MGNGPVTWYNPAPVFVYIYDRWVKVDFSTTPPKDASRG